MIRCSHPSNSGAGDGVPISPGGSSDTAAGEEVVHATQSKRIGGSSSSVGPIYQLAFAVWSATTRGRVRRAGLLLLLGDPQVGRHDAQQSPRSTPRDLCYDCDHRFVPGPGRVSAPTNHPAHGSSHLTDYNSRGTGSFPFSRWSAHGNRFTENHTEYMLSYLIHFV